VISEQDIDRALNYLRDNAEKDAQARAERLYMEQYLKTVLAQEQAKVGASSVAASEMGARVSEAYLGALGGYKQAIYEDEKRRFLRAAAETKIEAWRTMSSNERAQGKIG
jgi:hypothetical protein